MFLKQHPYLYRMVYWGSCKIINQQNTGKEVKLMELEQCINFILTKVQQSVQQSFKGELEPFGITPGQYMLLKCLWDENGATVKQLADRIQLDSSTITGILDRLENKGLTKRKPALNDRRALSVVLTSKGKALGKPVNQAIIDANNKVLGSLNNQELGDLKLLLQKINSRE
jgi:DNA-binding MarR family transcriptional regulator